MNGWLIYDYNQYKKNKWFADELISRTSVFCDIKLIIVEHLRFGVSENTYFFMYDGVRVDAPDFAICRAIYPLLSRSLEMAGTRVFNDSRISTICNDKRLTYLTVTNSGIPIQKTFFYDTRFSPASNSVFIQYPYILKSADGHGGNEVFWISNEEEYRTSINSIVSSGYLSQEICHTTGRDLRVYVLGGRIVASVLRSSDNFRSNYSLGGRIELISLSNKEVLIVKKILSLLPVIPDFVGIDFLVNDGEWVFNEIEDVVGTRMLYELTSLDIADLFSKHIHKEMTK